MLEISRHYSCLMWLKIAWWVGIHTIYMCMPKHTSTVAKNMTAASASCHLYKSCSKGLAAGNAGAVLVVLLHAPTFPQSCQTSWDGHQTSKTPQPSSSYLPPRLGASPEHDAVSQDQGAKITKLVMIFLFSGWYMVCDAWMGVQV